MDFSNSKIGGIIQSKTSKFRFRNSEKKLRKELDNVAALGVSDGFNKGRYIPFKCQVPVIAKTARLDLSRR